MDLMNSLRREKELIIPSGRMTHEQIGMILNLAAELDYNGYEEMGLEYVNSAHSSDDAIKYIIMLLNMVRKRNGEEDAEYGELSENKLIIKSLLKENIGMLNEERYNDLFEFLAQGFGKMTQGSVYYISSMDSSMNKNIIDSDTGEKRPNPMYGKLYKHTRYMFPWGDTYARAKERKGITTEPGKRSGEFEKLEGFDMLETGKNGLYLPIIPTGSEYEFAVLENNKFVPIHWSEAVKYLRPFTGGLKENANFRLLLVNNIVKLTGGGNEWVNPDMKFDYIGPGSI